MKPTLATSERIYMPSSIEEARENLPGKGRRIRITYSMGKNRAVTRKAVIVQKCSSHFTVELILEQRDGYRGRHRLGFMYVDIVTGRIKVREAKQ
jgi:uncharacterized protein Veg